MWSFIDYHRLFYIVMDGSELCLPPVIHYDNFRSLVFCIDRLHVLKELSCSFKVQIIFDTHHLGSISLCQAKLITKSYVWWRIVILFSEIFQPRKFHVEFSINILKYELIDALLIDVQTSYECWLHITKPYQVIRHFNQRPNRYLLIF